jgi:hypothetical protein
MIPEKLMKTYPQPTRAAASQAPLVEIPARGHRPARHGSFWPGENFATPSSRWSLRDLAAAPAFALPSLIGNRGPQTF